MNSHPQPQTFQKLLTKAVRTIAYDQNKSIQIVQDELGHALGRKNGSCIEYWRKGNIPGQVTDLELLVQQIGSEQGLSAAELEAFVLSTEPSFSRQRIQGLITAVSGVPLSLGQQNKTNRPMSPFIVGPPITEPRAFYGRLPELRRMFGWWKRQPLQNIAIVGPKRSGKTSLLHHLTQICQTPKTQLRPDQQNDWLPDADKFRWVLIDFQDPRLTQLDRLLRTILTHLNLPPPTPCTLEQFMDSLVGQIHQPTIILLDELIAGLESPELTTTFWWSLRSLVSHYTSGNLAFVLTAHDFPMRLAESEGKPSPFFNMFNTIQLGPMTETAALSLINSSPSPFSPVDIDWILARSECWPALVQILCQARLDALLGNLSAGADWQAEGVAQIGRFQYLLTS